MSTRIFGLFVQFNFIYFSSRSTDESDHRRRGLCDRLWQSETNIVRFVVRIDKFDIYMDIESVC